jgi:hypothetical protein
VSPPANHPENAPPSSRAILAPRSKVLIQWILHLWLPPSPQHWSQATCKSAMDLEQLFGMFRLKWNAVK